jgi:hypothetical protein
MISESVCLFLDSICSVKVKVMLSDEDMKVIRNLSGRKMTEEACKRKGTSKKISEANIKKVVNDNIIQLFKLFPLLLLGR